MGGRVESGASRAAVSVVVLVGTLAAVYMVSQFLRNSVGVIAPDLAAELDLSASQVGILSSVFFFAFAAAQLPLGIAIDRYGPKACMVVCAGVVVVGTALFAAAETASGAIAARALMGLGTSCYLMAPLALYAREFPPERFSILAGIQLGLGTTGALLATAPLAYVAAGIGWRATFLGVTAVMAATGLLVAAAVKESAPHATATRPESLRASIVGVREALRTVSVGPVFFMQMANYSSVVLIAGLWGGPYLTHVYGYGLAERGTILLVPVLAQMAGSLVWGSADRLFTSYKLPILTGALATGALLAWLAFAGAPPIAVLVAWLCLFGLFAAYTPVLIAHGKSLFPPRLIGRGMTLLNMGTMGGVFVSQTLTGAAIDLFPAQDGAYPLAAYRLTFAIQAVFVAVAVVAYLRAHDPRRAAVSSTLTPP